MGFCQPAPSRAAGNVLIFDEDIEDLARRAEPFEAHGFDVHKCMSVETAMRSVEREEFEFALVDQGSSVFEGRRVIRHLVRYNAYTPFVVVARPREMVWRQQALALGATDYLESPFPERRWIGLSNAISETRNELTRRRATMICADNRIKNRKLSEGPRR